MARNASQGDAPLRLTYISAAQGNTSCGLGAPIPASLATTICTPASRMRRNTSTNLRNDRLDPGRAREPRQAARVLTTVTPRSFSRSITSSSGVAPASSMNEQCSIMSKPAFYCVDDSRRAVGVGGDGQAVPMGLIGQRAQLVGCVRGLMRHGARGELAAGRHHLDDVHAAFGAFANGRPDAFHAFGFATEVPAVSFHDGHRWAGGQDLRPGERVGRALVAQSQCLIAAVAEVTHGRDARRRARRAAVRISASNSSSSTVDRCPMTSVLALKHRWMCASIRPGNSVTSPRSSASG
jgi:hypothetical protein